MKRAWRIPQVQREPQRLAIKALGEYDTLGLVIREVGLHKRYRAHPLRGFVGWPTADGNDTWALFFRREEDSGDMNELRLLWRRCRDHVHIIAGRSWGRRKTFFAVTRPVTGEVVWRTVPRALTAATPHGRRAAADGAGVVNCGHCVHFR